MDIKKHSSFFVFILLLLCVHHLATKLVTASTTPKETTGTNSHAQRLIQEQKDGTIDICSATKLATASTTPKETTGTYSHVQRLIQEQKDGTIDICSDILGPEWNNEINQTQNDQCQNLTVWAAKNVAFPEFVDFSEDGELKGGFSIAMFCLVLQQLPFKIQPVFKQFNIKDSYDDLVMQIEGKDCEAVGGDIAISANRTKYVDFTIPYVSSQIYMLVPTSRKWNQTLATLIKPFTIRLWLTIISASIFIGISIGFLEYRAGNSEFKVPFYQKLLLIIWYPISTFFFHEGRILNRCSRSVLVIWLIMIFIVMQIYTACLSSWLTVNQLQPKLPRQYHEVGYQNGSFISDFANRSTQCQLLPLSSVDEYKVALDNGTVDAIFDELPYIDIFLAKFGDGYVKVGPLADDPGLGFAFSLGNPLLPYFSSAIVKVINESDKMANMKIKYLGVLTAKKYFGKRIEAQTTESLPQSLDVHPFFFLFIFMGLGTIVAIICSEISLKRKPAKNIPAISIQMSSVQTISANSTQSVENEH